jgi:bacteriocin biosynthesis cyclodehydratase domain-containing protein
MTRPGRRGPLRDDLEVVAMGSRLVLCVGNETYELAAPDSRSVAAALELLGSGVPEDRLSARLGLPEVGVHAIVSELVRLGCFDGTPPTALDGPLPPLPDEVGICGSGPLGIALAVRLQAVGCRISLAGSHPWSSDDATSLPGSAGLVGHGSTEVARARLGPGTPAAEVVELDPFAPEFSDWVTMRRALLLASGSLRPATHERVNALCGERRIPWLSVRSGRTFAEVGPLVEPPTTPCYACLALRGVLNRSAIPSSDPAASSPRLESAWSPGDRVELAAMFALHELRQLGRRPPPPVSSVVRLDWGSGAIQRWPVLKLPNCPGCEWWPNEPVPR